MSGNLPRHSAIDPIEIPVEDNCNGQNHGGEDSQGNRQSRTKQRRENQDRGR
jgi:hypothetical protein